MAGLFQRMMSRPGAMNMALMGLGALTAKKQPQANAYISGISRSLAGQEQWNREAPMRELEMRKLRAEIEAAENPAGATPKIQELADGRKYWVTPGMPPVLVAPNMTIPEPKMSGEEIFDTESKLRKEYNDQSKEFIKQSQAYQRVVDSAQDPSAAGDLALIFNYMKVLDPGSTVREGEFATAQSAGGVGSRVRAIYNMVVDGKRLSHKQRADFVDRAGRLYSGALGMQASTDERYRSLSDAYKVTPENILYGPGIDIYQYPQELIDSEVAAPEMQIIYDADRNGKEIYSEDGGQTWFYVEDG